MSMRSATLYVEPKTVKRLRLALKLYPQFTRDRGDVAMEQRLKTPDELGDALLNEGITQKFPLVKELEKLLAAAEKDFVEKSLKT